jgi:hypothetical protein
MTRVVVTLLEVAAEFVVGAMAFAMTWAAVKSLTGAVVEIGVEEIKFRAGLMTVEFASAGAVGLLVGNGALVNTGVAVGAAACVVEGKGVAEFGAGVSVATGTTASVAEVTGVAELGAGVAVAAGTAGSVTDGASVETPGAGVNVVAGATACVVEGTGVAEFGAGVDVAAGTAVSVADGTGVETLGAGVASRFVADVGVTGGSSA